MKHGLESAAHGARAVAMTVAAWVAIATGCGSSVSDGGLFSAVDASTDAQGQRDSSAPSSGAGSSSGTGPVGTGTGSTGTGSASPPPSSGTGTGTDVDSGITGTGTGGGGGYEPSDPGAGDQPGSCVPAAGEPPCTPGTVTCSQSVSCNAPEVCCVKMNGATCVASPNDCNGGASLACEEAGDCPAGQACCGSLSNQTGKTTCQTLDHGACPSDPASVSVQVCRSDNECPSGKCSVYRCANQTIEACTNPSTMFCTAE